MTVPQIPSDPDPPIGQFIERFGSALTQAGVPRLPSRVFGALLIDDDGRMTAVELAQTLAVSPAAISGAVNYLERVGLLRRERDLGSRRDVFVVLEDAWHGAVLRKDQAYLTIENALAEGVEAVGGPATPAGTRLDLSLKFLEFVGAEMDGVIARWEERKAELREARDQPP